MAIKYPPMKAEEFEAFARQPENVHRRLELICGEVGELISNEESRRVTVRIARLIKSYLDQHPIGHATPPGIGYKVGDDRYMPDVGFISNARLPILTNEAYVSLAPSLALEVVSPTDELDGVLAKVSGYQRAGTTVWVVYPKSKGIRVLVPGQPSKKLGLGDTLDGGEVLPGFTASLEKIFEGE